MLNQKQQGRLDGFFKVTPKDKPAGSAKNAKDTKKTTGKRKVRMMLASVSEALLIPFPVGGRERKAWS